MDESTRRSNALRGDVESRKYFRKKFVLRVWGSSQYDMLNDKGPALNYTRQVSNPQAGKMFKALTAKEGRVERASALSFKVDEFAARKLQDVSSARCCLSLGSFRLTGPRGTVGIVLGAEGWGRRSNKCNRANPSDSAT